MTGLNINQRLATDKPTCYDIGVIGRHWLSMLLATICAVGGFFLVFGGSQVVVIHGDISSSTPPATVPTSTPPVTTPTSTPSSTEADTAGPVQPFNITYPPVAGGTVDTALYDAKLLALANIPVVTKTIKVSSTLMVGTTTKVVWSTSTVTSSPKTGWPAKADYPNSGALLPFYRIVAYYGNFYSTQMGVLGQYSPDVVLAKLASTSAMWQAADPSTPVIPAIQYIAVTAQGSAGADGKYRLRMPDSQIDKAIEMANKLNGIVFLDVQVGLSTPEIEVPLLEKYLSMPRVFLALDPEFDMHNGARPGTVIGTMDAQDINWAASYLANLVRKNNLPPKILIVHRFTDAMVTHTMSIKPLPEVQIVMDMDGFGFPAKKINTYQQVVVPYPIQFTGFKLFYHNDTLGEFGHLMTPQEVLKLSPKPIYIQYQ